MYIIDVIPLTFIPRNQSQFLSYFYKEPLSRGAVIECALGSRKIKGIVVSSQDIKESKLNFKKNVNFSLKGINNVISAEPSVSEQQLKIAKYMSDYYYAPLGICLQTVLPPFWGKKKYQLPADSERLLTTDHLPLVTSVRTNLSDHPADYRQAIEKQIKSGRQTFLMVAESTAALYLIEQYKKYEPIFMSSDLSNKEYYNVWKNVSDGTKLIIGTRVGLFLPFKNLGLIIVDDESNEFYKSDMMPRYNGTDLADFITKLYGARIIKSSVLPPIHGISSASPPTYNLKFKTDIVDMIREIKLGNFSIFSRDLKDAIFKNIEYGKNTILYIPRRGYANFIVCEKCGNTIKCPNCTASLVIHKPEAMDEMQCHHCNYRGAKPKLCSNCGSYKLKSHGVGIEKVEEELKKMFEYANIKVPEILQLDSDTSKNKDEKELEIIDKFKQSKNVILLATQIIFSHKYYLESPLIGILNADTLINIPDFRAEESLLRQTYTLGQMTDRLILQTYNIESPAPLNIARNNIKEFVDNELKNRNTFGYPPYSQLIKLTYRHKNPVRVRNGAKILAEKLNWFMGNTKDELQNINILGPSPAFISREKGFYVWNIIIKSKIKNQKSKVEELEEIKMRNELLRIVPNGWLVDVDPVRAI